MSEINTNAVLDGITLALRAAYPSSKIESGTIEQGLTPPAFVVHLVTGGMSPLTDGRWRQSARFDVIYFPMKGREDCHLVADELAIILGLITMPQGDKLRGVEMDWNIVDGVLHFLVAYKFNAFLPGAEPEMEELKLQQGGM